MTNDTKTAESVSAWTLLYAIYVVSCWFFIPYFWWQFAQTHGPMSSFFLGSWLSIFKGAFWPVYIIGAGINSEFIIVGTVSIGVITVLLMLGARLLAKIRLPFFTALLTSFIAWLMTTIIAAVFGFFFENHIGPAMIFAEVIIFFVQAILFHISIKATSQILSFGRAFILSLLVILTNFFVVSPIVVLIIGDASK